MLKKPGVLVVKKITLHSFFELNQPYIPNSLNCCFPSSLVMPAKAGIQWLRQQTLDPGLRRDDGKYGFSAAC
jgi:hypothetical protein